MAVMLVGGEKHFEESADTVESLSIESTYLQLVSLVHSLEYSGISQ